MPLPPTIQYPAGTDCVTGGVGGGTTSVYDAVYVADVCALTMCVAAPLSDQPANVYVFASSVCVVGALTCTCEFTTHVCVNGAACASWSPTVSIIPAGLVCSVNVATSG